MTTIDSAGQTKQASDPQQTSAIPLLQTSAGEMVELVSVHGGKAFLHRLAEMGMFPGVRFQVKTTGNPGPFVIHLGGTRLMLGQAMVQHVLVRPVRSA